MVFFILLSTESIGVWVCMHDMHLGQKGASARAPDSTRGSLGRAARATPVAEQRSLREAEGVSQGPRAAFLVWVCYMLLVFCVGETVLI